MKFQDFLAKYNGKYIDFDGWYGAQCMDLMHQYILEVLGLLNPRILAAPCAADVFNKFTKLAGHKFFERMPNTPLAVPQEGDVMLWGSGRYGHVAIFIEGDVNRFKSFDQNYPTGSPCHVQSHNYSSVLGWLRYKKQNTCQDELDKCRKARDDHWNLLSAIAKELDKPVDKDILLEEIRKFIKYEDIIREKEKLLQKKDKQLENVQKEVSDLRQRVNELSSAVSEAQGDNLALKEKLQKQAVTIQQLDNQLKQLEGLKPIDKYEWFELLKMGFTKFIRG